MRKVLVTILAIVYLASSVGAVVTTHYCMGKPVGRSMTYAHHVKCSKCGMETKHGGHGCCSDSQQTVRNADDALLLGNADWNLQSASSYVVSSPTVNLAMTFPYSSEEISWTTHPPGSPTAVYLRVCVLRI